jgi:hypothetical protein
MKRLVPGLLLLLAACASQPAHNTRQTLAPPKGEAADLTGMSGVRLQELFGRPALSRKEYGSEMWRYDGKSCRAFFFLYPQGSGLVVRHIESVPHSPNATFDPACLSALRAKPASPLS